ncbi:MAG: spore coat protein CotJB [Bacillota bacterium]|nr:spore coat protein CotJB [Bacillota bacterium]
MDREELLKKLSELDFIAVDLGLYLNTHPNHTEAIQAYNQVITAADAVRMKYEAAYGPLCSFRSYAENTQNWQWQEDPWPWQKAANFTLAGKECK